MIETWIGHSEAFGFRSGKRVFQLTLIDGVAERTFPLRCEDYEEYQIRGLYDSIRSRIDVNEFIYNEQERIDAEIKRRSQ
ncbi:hypothetical protein HY500_00430 [Candidatus Woesearchaeota archaeon]|nr:hypothetical protein [Candidatus Woesearchaeota archaeon]